jgi:hypothetical protein
MRKIKTWVGRERERERERSTREEKGKSSKLFNQRIKNHLRQKKRDGVVFEAVWNSKKFKIFLLFIKK